MRRTRVARRRGWRARQVVRVKVLGCLAMIDDGETDWKVICIACDDPLAPKLNDIDDVDRVMPGTISVMREWFRNYKTVDGKPQNAFGMEEKAMNREYTLKVQRARRPAGSATPTKPSWPLSYA